MECWVISKHDIIPSCSFESGFKKSQCARRTARFHKLILKEQLKYPLLFHLCQVEDHPVKVNFLCMLSTGGECYNSIVTNVKPVLRNMIYLSSSSSEWHSAPTMLPSFVPASCKVMSPTQVYTNSWSCALVVLLHVVRGLADFRFPGGVQCEALFGIFSQGILWTWPSPLKHRFLICARMFLYSLI